MSKEHEKSQQGVADERATSPEKQSNDRKNEVTWAVYEKIAVIEQLLINRTLSAQETIGALFTAWERIDELLAQIEVGDFSTGAVNSPDASLGKVAALKDKWLPRLASALISYLKFVPSRLDREVLTACKEDLVLAIGLLRDNRPGYTPVPVIVKQLLTLKHVAIAGGVVVFVVLAWLLILALLAPAADEGLSALYCNALSTPPRCVERIDHSIDFDWEENSPMSELSKDRFKIEWRGCLQVPPETAPVLIAGADDGIRIYVDGKKLIDDFKAGPYREHRAGTPLKPGVHQIRVSYWESLFQAKVYLGWSMKGKIPHAIPPENLIPAGGNRRFKCKEKKASNPNAQK